jgi:uncharacterized protein YegP (UPF0339 family)
MNVDASKETNMYFVVRKNAQGKFWWRAVADGNNKILAASEMMEHKADCLHAISIVRGEAVDSNIIDRTDETSTRGSV